MDESVDPAQRVLGEHPDIMRGLLDEHKVLLANILHKVENVKALPVLQTQGRYLEVEVAAWQADILLELLKPPFRLLERNLRLLVEGLDTAD